MPATVEQATDEIVAQFKAAWDASAYSSLQVVYDDQVIDDSNRPSPSAAWARLTVQHNAPGDEGYGDAQRLYEALGVFAVQLFKPIGAGTPNIDQMVQVVIDAFRGKETASGVIFQRVHAVDIGPSAVAPYGSQGTKPIWYQKNVTGEFKHYEIA